MMQVSITSLDAEDSAAPLGLRSRSVVLFLAQYAGALVLCLVILIWCMRLWQMDLRFPFFYQGDALVVQSYIKTGMENRWYWHNHKLVLA